MVPVHVLHELGITMVGSDITVCYNNGSIEETTNTSGLTMVGHGLHCRNLIGCQNELYPIKFNYFGHAQ